MELDDNLLNAFTAALVGGKETQPISFKKGTFIYSNDYHYVLLDDNMDGQVVGYIKSGPNATKKEANLFIGARRVLNLSMPYNRPWYTWNGNEWVYHSSGTLTETNDKDIVIGLDDDDPNAYRYHKLTDTYNNVTYTTERIDLFVPCETWVHVVPGDRVAVKIENGQADIVANLTSPAATIRDLENT